MTTVVNNPVPVQNNGDEKGMGFFIGVVLLILFGAIILYFAVPAIRNMGPVQINMPAPEVNIPAPQVNVQAPQSSPSN
jgi:hypothetical protein